MVLYLSLIKSYTTNIPIILKNQFKLDNSSIGLLGCCPVFETVEQARVYYPNSQMVEIKHTKNKGE